MMQKESPNTPVHIFDPARIRHNRQRALSGDFSQYDFLFSHARQSLLDRFSMIKKNFATAAIYGARDQSIIDALPIDTAYCFDLFQHESTALAADPELWPFAYNSLDLVLSNLNLHWINDLPGTLVQIQRSLKPDGLLLAAMLGGNSLTELRMAMTQAESAVRGGASPHISPFVDMRDMGALLQRTGYALPVIDSEVVSVSYGSAQKLMHDLRYMGEGNALAQRDKRPLSKTLLAEIERCYADSFTDNDGRLIATFEIIYVIGWAPHSSQQQPLKPGSAQTRLSDALSAQEESVPQ